MPLYEFKCRGCGEQFEGLVRSGETPACPACKSLDLERLISTFGVNSPEMSRTRVRKERARLAPIHKANQREEEQHIIREHMDHE
jgi:putative FmdB family regulatory protein